MDAEPTKAEKICLLVQRLREVLADVGYEPLAWDTIEKCVAGFAGWSTFIHNMRYPNRSIWNWAAHTTHPLAFSEHPTFAEYELLFAVFEPYGILLDPVLDKSQKVERIEACIEFNEQTPFFWEDALDNPDTEIHAHTLELLYWIEANRSLLRGANAPENDGKELLRGAKPTDTENDNLLRAGNTPEETPPKPAGFWARLRGRR